MYLLNPKQTAAVVAELKLPLQHNVLVCNYVVNSAQRKARQAADYLLTSGLPWFTEDNWRVSVLVFMPGMVYLCIKEDRLARFDPAKLASTVVRIPKSAITNFNFGASAEIDGPQQWRLSFDYQVAGQVKRYYGLFGGTNDDSDNERCLRYLASNGFYYLTEPFAAPSYRELHLRLMAETKHH
ncbi:hypothetical protein [Lacticaseibacillus zhaodongensis]|uniref:hypothetical protein n=1 Tax=Lacticaseibacillus zhaodongensis TaxID=2668065 RepID=UPI0012D2FF03|nr:hypothetical protein [Lacticaseibacillus zhaodongensis]